MGFALTLSTRQGPKVSVPPPAENGVATASSRTAVATPPVVGECAGGAGFYGGACSPAAALLPWKRELETVTVPSVSAKIPPPAPIPSVTLFPVKVDPLIVKVTPVSSVAEIPPPEITALLPLKVEPVTERLPEPFGPSTNSIAPPAPFAALFEKVQLVIIRLPGASKSIAPPLSLLLGLLLSKTTLVRVRLSPRWAAGEDSAATDLAVGARDAVSLAQRYVRDC